MGKYYTANLVDRTVRIATSFSMNRERLRSRLFTLERRRLTPSLIRLRESITRFGS
jgi:hypothetical protein